MPTSGTDAAVASVDEILHRRGAVGLALGVVRDGDLDTFVAHGVADVVARTPVTADTVFRVASITKTFTAVAVMQLVERGAIDLDAPANDYLRAYRLVPRNEGWRPATVRQLLTHTAGIPEIAHPWAAFAHDFGESVPVGAPVPSLAAYYRGGLAVVAEPGTRFRYGNHGPATLGQIVEDVTGERLARYVRTRIFEPLGMMDSDLERTARVTSKLATGYRLGGRGPTPVALRTFVTTGAASAFSTPRDMARYAAALLGGGSNEHGSVLEPATVAMMFAPQYQPDPRIPGMGLTFFRVDLGGHPAVEHQGTMPGFDSQLFLAPADGVGVIAFTNGARAAPMWLPAEVAGVLRPLIGAADDAVRTDLPQRPDLWGAFCGRYWLTGPLSDLRLRMFLGAGAEVFVRNGRLMLRFLSPVPALYRGFALLPDDVSDPYVLRAELEEFGIRVVLDPGPGDVAMRLHLDLMPITLYRRPAEDRGVRPSRRRSAARPRAGGSRAASSSTARRPGAPVGTPGTPRHRS